MAILAVGSGFMDRISLPFVGGAEQAAQIAPLDSVEAAEAAIACSAAD